MPFSPKQCSAQYEGETFCLQLLPCEDLLKIFTYTECNHLIKTSDGLDFLKMNLEESRAMIKTLKEVSSAYIETAHALTDASTEVNELRPMIPKGSSDQERSGLVKIGSKITHFPGFVPSIFLNELLYHKMIGMSFVAAGLLQEKRRPADLRDVCKGLSSSINELQDATEETI